MIVYINVIEMAYCRGFNGCGDLIIAENMVTAYFRRNGSKVPKSICRNCTRKQKSVRATLEISHPRPPSGSECDICGRVSRLNLDHCHATDQFRGYLCQQCNVACGLLGDNSKNVKRALNYMQRFEDNNKCQNESSSTSSSKREPDL